MVPFFEICPTLAASETRVITFLKDKGGIPAGEYGFLESYCTDTNCDCQRVLLNVLGQDGSRVEATISLGFDPQDEMSEPFLDPFNPQGQHAEKFLDFVINLIADDPDYYQRLVRHYVITKSIMSGELAPEDAPPSPAIVGYQLMEAGRSRSTTKGAPPIDRDNPSPHGMNREERRAQGKKANRRKR